MDYRKLVLTYNIRFFDGENMCQCNCTPEVLSEVLKVLMDEGKRIEEVKSHWI